MAVEGGNLMFHEDSNGDEFNVDLTQQSRDYFEHFQMYKFYYTMCMTFSRDVDSEIFVSDLLNIYSDTLERIFRIILQVMFESVQLQHFNRAEIINSDYIQFTLEHSDIDCVFMSRSVAHENFQYHRVIGGIIYLLNNSAQSNQMINIGNEWIICLMVSRTEEVPRGMRKGKAGVNDHEEFPVKLVVIQEAEQMICLEIDAHW